MTSVCACACVRGRSSVGTLVVRCWLRQVEQSLTDPLRVALVFSSQGLPYSIGRAALDALETTYDLIFTQEEEKEQFVEEVRRVRVRVCACVHVLSLGTPVAASSTTRASTTFATTTHKPPSHRILPPPHLTPTCCNTAAPP